MSTGTTSISVIIPCYNSGSFLPEAIQSVKAYKGKHTYEIIIVDDGSTEADTLNFLNNVSGEDAQVIRQKNGGPAAARNTGIKMAKAPYILFLDSDNKIKPAYIDKAISVLESKPKVGVVYGNATFFGEEKRGNFTTYDFDIGLLIAKNYIDICTVIRKAVWEQVGGLDESRELIGHEDWDFWLSVYQAGWQFEYINKHLYDYRLRAGSLISTESEEKYKKKVAFIYGKHASLINRVYVQNLTTSKIYADDLKKPLRSFIKYMNKKYLKKGK